jgi:hypothetical protein
MYRKIVKKLLRLEIHRGEMFYPKVKLVTRDEDEP